MGVLDGIQNNNSEPQPNIEDIASYAPDGMRVPQQNYDANRKPLMYNGQDISDQVTSPGALPYETYFPGAMNNINKGSYSGSIVGSVPIYASSDLLPFGLYDAREKALQQAAANKSKQIEQLQKDMYNVPQLKNAPDQPEMNNIYLNGMDKWKKMYGGDVKAMSQDPRFKKWQEDVKTAGRINDAAFNQYGQMAKDMDEGKKYFSPETRNAMKGFLSGLATLHDPTHPDSQNFTNKAFNLDQSAAVDKTINEVIQHYKAPVTEGEASIKKHGIYDVITSKEETNKDREAINKLADDTWENVYKGTNTISKEAFRARMQEALPYSNKNQVQTHANQFAPRENKGAEVPETYNLNQKEDQRSLRVVGRKGAEGSLDLTNVFKLNTTDQKKEISYPIGPGLHYTNGDPVKGEGYVKGTISEIGVGKVYKKGLKLPVGVYDPKTKTTNYVTKDVGGMPVGSMDIGNGVDPNNPSFYEHKPVAILNVSESQGGAAGKGVANKTITVPLSDIKNHFVNPKKKQGEKDLTDIADESVIPAAKTEDAKRHQAVVNYASTLKSNNTSAKPSTNSGKLKPSGEL